MAANARTVWRNRADALRHPGAAVRFVLTSREVSNFTYDLENLDELLGSAGRALRVAPEALGAYARELARDDGLRSRLRARYATRADRNREPHYGKRVVTYAIVRALAPEHVAESGTHDGLSAVLIAAALRRNAAEGRPGRLSTFDPNPAAGWLLGDEDREVVTRHTAATVDALAVAVRDGVDVFIHDSLRTPENERLEYDIALAGARGERLLVLCDDIRTTDALARLCAEHDARLIVLRERPSHHWWPGNALGLASIPLRRRAVL